MGYAGCAVAVSQSLAYGAPQITVLFCNECLRIRAEGRPRHLGHLKNLVSVAGKVNSLSSGAHKPGTGGSGLKIDSLQNSPRTQTHTYAQPGGLSVQEVFTSLRVEA